MKKKRKDEEEEKKDYEKIRKKGATSLISSEMQTSSLPPQPCAAQPVGPRPRLCVLQAPAPAAGRCDVKQSG